MWSLKYYHDTTYFSFVFHIFAVSLIHACSHLSDSNNYILIFSANIISKVSEFVVWLLVDLYDNFNYNFNSTWSYHRGSYWHAMVKNWRKNCIYNVNFNLFYDRTLYWLLHCTFVILWFCELVEWFSLKPPLPSWNYYDSCCSFVLWVSSI